MHLLSLVSFFPACIQLLFLITSHCSPASDPQSRPSKDISTYPLISPIPHDDLSLLPRTPPQFPAKDLKLIKFDHNDNISPVGAAAVYLTHFYTQLILAVRGPWAGLKPRTWVKITWGSIELLLTATAGGNIPWDFVEWFAEWMLEKVQQGLVAIYDSYWTDPQGAVGVLASLTYKGAVSAASRALGGIVNGDVGVIGDGRTKPLDAQAKPFNPP
ncbi:hypothetical protein ACLMJK_001305 [Lecanora helva]